MKKPSGRKKTAAKIIAGVTASVALCLNVNGCVYGPGPERETTDHHDSDSSETTTFDPAENELRAVYGPPEDMIIDEEDLEIKEEQSEVSEADDDFEADEPDEDPES